MKRESNHDREEVGEGKCSCGGDVNTEHRTEGHTGSLCTPLL